MDWTDLFHNSINSISMETKKKKLIFFFLEIISLSLVQNLS